MQAGRDVAALRHRGSGRRESLYQDTSLQALQQRGVKMLSCHTALEEQVRALIAHNSLTQQPEEIVVSAHAARGVGCSVDGRSDRASADGRYSYITV